MKSVLAIDPGCDKCGIALVTTEGLVHKEIAPRTDVVRIASSLSSKHRPDEIIIGNGTGGGSLAEEIRAAVGAVPVSMVEEAYSSEKARRRFLLDNPPRGIRRLIPRGLLTPNRPYDDYAAIILAEARLETVAE